MPPFSGIRKASVGCIPLYLQVHLYSKTLFRQPSEHWHFWTLSTLTRGERLWFWNYKAFWDQFQFVVGMAGTRWYALRALSSRNNTHSLRFCGSTSWFLPQLCGDLSSTIPFMNLLTSFSFFFFFFFNGLLPGEDSFTLWSCYETSLVNIPFLPFPLHWRGELFIISFCITEW